jgi:hypothetical protein
MASSAIGEFGRNGMWSGGDRAHAGSESKHIHVLFKACTPVFARILLFSSGRDGPDAHQPWIRVAIPTCFRCSDFKQ